MVMISYDYTLLLLLVIATTFEIALSWEGDTICSKVCTKDKKTVCLYGENVPKCYADCLGKVSRNLYLVKLVLEVPK